MELSNFKDVKALLASEGFSFKKSLGQNFIIDSTVCPAMAEAACDSETGVIEIGPGAGVLTAELGKRAKKVIAIELDERLRPILKKTVGGFENVKVIFADVMKTDLHKLIEDEFADCKKINVCANLPYYITSPIIMMLLESKLPIGSVTAMVQKEAAERLCARVGSRESGAVTVTVNYYSEGEILFDVLRDSFMPPPNDDSAVIRLNVRPEPPISVEDEKTFFSLVKACFAQRRKTMLNTVSSTMKLDKAALKGYLEQIDCEPTVRGEQLDMEQLGKLSDLIFQNR